MSNLRLSPKWTLLCLFIMLVNLCQWPLQPLRGNYPPFFWSVPVNQNGMFMFHFIHYSIIKIFGIFLFIRKCHIYKRAFLMLNKWLQVAARVFLLPVESYSQSDFITRLILIIIKQKLAVYLDCDCLKRSVRALQITISFYGRTFTLVK